MNKNNMTYSQLFNALACEPCESTRSRIVEQMLRAIDGLVAECEHAEETAMIEQIALDTKESSWDDMCNNDNKNKSYMIYNKI